MKMGIPMAVLALLLALTLLCSCATGTDMEESVQESLPVSTIETQETEAVVHVADNVPKGIVVEKSNPVPSYTGSEDEWWNNPPSDTADYHYEVSYGEGSNPMTSMAWARANVNIALAQYVSNSIEAIVVTYVNDAGEGSNMQAMQAFESISRQRTQAVLTGVTYKFHEMGKGVFVLAALPIGDFAKELKEIVSETFSKDEAFIGEGGLMDAAIDKYFD